MSMEMSMSLECRQTQRQRLSFELSIAQCMILVGGATTSIFPRAEAWLLADSEHQKAFEWLCPKSRQRHYRSMMDCLFCELYTEFRPACRRFYQDEGPQLREHLWEEDRQSFEATLLYACKHALELYQQQTEIPWLWFCWEVMDNAA